MSFYLFKKMFVFYHPRKSKSIIDPIDKLMVMNGQNTKVKQFSEEFKIV